MEAPITNAFVTTLRAFAGAALLIAAAGVHSPSGAQADVAASACDDPALDPLSAKACRAQALAAAEDDLDAVLAALRATARNIDAVERRRTAIANVDAAHNAWRLLRDHDCGLDAALAPPDADASEIQITCAIARTRARIAELSRFIGDAPAPSTNEEARVVADAAAQPEPHALDTPAASFRDWGATCRDDGSCAAFTLARDAAEGAASVLRLERRNPGADWSAHLIVATPPGDGADVTASVDRLAPIVFQAGYEVANADGELAFAAPLKTARLFEGLLAGLDLTVAFDDDDGGARSEAFSLRGASSALDWIERNQPRPEEGG